MCVHASHKTLLYSMYSMCDRVCSWQSEIKKKKYVEDNEEKIATTESADRSEHTVRKTSSQWASERINERTNEQANSTS